MNRKHYHAGCLKVLRLLALDTYGFGLSLSSIATGAGLSETGASARVRQLRNKFYGCTVEAKIVGHSTWRYRLVHAPKHLLKLAREMQQ